MASSMAPPPVPPEPQPRRVGGTHPELVEVFPRGKAGRPGLDQKSRYAVPSLLLVGHGEDDNHPRDASLRDEHLAPVDDPAVFVPLRPGPHVGPVRLPSRGGPPTRWGARGGGRPWCAVPPDRLGT